MRKRQATSKPANILWSFCGAIVPLVFMCGGCRGVCLLHCLFTPPCGGAIDSNGLQEYPDRQLSCDPDVDTIEILVYYDACPEDPEKTDPGLCGCGVPDTDTDDDGTADCHDDCPGDPDKTDLGLCGCGAFDTDTDGDGTADCHDGCPEDADKTVPGLCGCGWPDPMVGSGDIDGNGVIDGRDIHPFMNEVFYSTAPSKAACAADMNDDGKIDGDDVSLFVGVVLGS